MSFKSTNRFILFCVLSFILVPSISFSATILNVRICQSLLCTDFGPAGGPGPFVNNNITVGDFTISGSVSSLENPLLSNAATTTIAVQRVSNNFAGDDLDIWLNSSNYTVLDLSAGYIFQTTSSFTSSGSNESVEGSFQGWLSPGNVVGFPPAGSDTPGSNSCTLVPDTDSCAAAIGILVGAVGINPFTMTTRTTFNISQASSIASYTSNAQANITPIPESSSLFLLGTGLMGLMGLIRRKSSKRVSNTVVYLKEI